MSRLAQHILDLLADPRVSLLFIARLDEGLDPLALPRLTLQGGAAAIPTGSTLEAAAGAYLARFPQAEMTLGLGDFSFFRIQPTSRRLVSGFGRAFSLDVTQIEAGLSRSI